MIVADVTCLEFATGERMRRHRSVGRGSLDERLARRAADLYDDVAFLVSRLRIPMSLDDIVE